MNEVDNVDLLEMTYWMLKFYDYFSEWMAVLVRLSFHDPFNEV